MHGYQHTAINLTCTTLVCGSLLILNHPLTAISLGVGLLFGTLLVTPDLDLQFNDARRRWGKLKAIWEPYAALSKHRGMSHTFLIGPTVRLLYLTCWFAPLLLLLHWLPHVTLPQGSLQIAALFLLGYFLAQWLHLLCDGILPFQQRGRTSSASRGA
ncbi:DUF2227 family putative metal-binding protein [Deinococcus ruber]|uniref:DUF2227 family putative metal-binding protein n=1 Tax=Deinococcus ruber TaxID=1848197 RepID=UPI0016686B27|nr:DUF2227 family putative metal-binding protein [Deinococcus ruber]